MNALKRCAIGLSTLLRSPALCWVPLLLAMWSSLATIRAQDQPTRFRLPEVPYDYVELQMPDGLPGVPLPERSDTEDTHRANALAAFGRVLFYDRQLSANGSRSCASCHQQKLGFADDKKRSKGFRGKRTHRNSMSIANLRFHDGRLFWDGRSSRLEDLVLMPIDDVIEMGLPLADLVARLREDKEYEPLLEAAFGSGRVTRDRIAEGLAAFVRAIVSLQSKFDVGYAAAGSVRHDFANFSKSENRGKALFFGIGGSIRHSCASCHVERVHTFCGTCFRINPAMFASPHCRNNGIDRGKRSDDPGFSAISGKPEDRGKFRAPSLRNIEVTGPYMHDGRFETLVEVVKFYANGVRRHANLDDVLRPSKTAGAGWGGSRGRPIGPLTLGTPSTPISLPSGFPMGSREQKHLVAFLRTLTDHKLLSDPRYSDPFVR